MSCAVLPLPGRTAAHASLVLVSPGRTEGQRADPPGSALQESWVMALGVKAQLVEVSCLAAVTVQQGKAKLFDINHIEMFLNKTH